MRTTALLVSLALVALGGPAAAQKAPSYDPQVAFAQTDRNGDGRIDRAEFHGRMVEIFFHADRDKDGLLTMEEIEAGILFPGDLSEADTDGDGLVSLHEFVRVRFQDYYQVDTDGDGLLSLEEVTAVFESGGVR